MDAKNPNKSEEPSKAATSFRFLVAIIVIVVLFLVGFIPKMMNNRRIDARASEVANGAPEVVPVSPRLADPDPLILPGSFQAITEAAIQARTTGYISKLYVDIGSKVKAGQILADIESPDVDQQVAQAFADTAKSRATVGQSLATVDQLEAGVLQNDAEIQHQRAAVVQAQAALEGAKAQKQNAVAALSQSKARLLQSTQQILVQKAALSQAEAQFALSSANRRRYSQLLAQGFVAQQDYDQAEATFRTNDASIRSAQANVGASEADAKAAEEAVHSSEASVQSAQSAIDAAVANVKAAEAVLGSSIANLKAAKASLAAGKQSVSANVAQVGSSVANQRRYQVLQSFSHVVAPFDGVITQRNVDVGALLSPGQTAASNTANQTPTSGLFSMARVDTLRLFVNLPQSDYFWAKTGTPCDITVREVPHRIFRGTVHQSSGALDTTTRTLLTEIRLPNPRDVLLPGMYAQVEFAGGGEKKIRIPASAIMVDAQGSRALVIGSDNKIHYRKIVLGRDYGTEAEVLSGIQINDRLVSNPTDDLVDGESVKVLPPAQTTSPNGQPQVATPSGQPQSGAQPQSGKSNGGGTA